MYKNQLDLVFDSGHTPCKLSVSTQPNNIALFFDHVTQKRSTNVAFVFQQLLQDEVVSINLTQNDRIITITLGKGLSIICLLFGSRPNILIVDQHFCIVDAFKHAKQLIGMVFEYPKSAQSEWLDQEKATFKAQVLARIPTLDRKWISWIENKRQDFTSTKALIEQLEFDLCKESNEPVYLLKEGVLFNLPEYWLPSHDLVVQSYHSANEAIKASYLHKVKYQRFYARYKQLSNEIEKKEKRLRSKLVQLRALSLDADIADRFESFGHMLMAQAYNNDLNIKDGKLEIASFEDVDKLLSIKVDEKLSMIENAEKYYAKARHARQQASEKKQEIENLEIELYEVEQISSQLSDIEEPEAFRAWEKEYAEWLKELATTTRVEAMQKPFKVFRIANYTVWVGKNAKSNDHILRQSHKEDIWMHAKDVAGSHVLIKMDGKKTVPPLSILEQVASVAAFNSKLRGSSLVPVSYTKRKFVRKPKGAAAGLALVDREDVLIVPPINH